MSLVDPARPDAPVTAAGGASRSTVLVSLAAHVVVLVAIVVVPLFGSVELPAPSTRITAFVKATAYQRIPEAAAPAATKATTAAATSTPAAAPSVASAAAPITAPTGIAEGEAPSMPTAAGVQGGLDGVTGAVFGQRSDGVLTPPPPPVPTPTPKTVRVGGQIQAPRKLRHVAPLYPQIAQQARVTGTVILEAVLSPTGAVSDVKVLRSVPLLDQAAIDAVRQWTYAPTLLNGTPVSVLMTVTVRFEQ
ncbi:MAG TPA: energy transducer TonB [Luteitalea sp.]|nr:energy transducer TonB [Luteitalea sp.]